jgi:hypothetical protein
MAIITLDNQTIPATPASGKVTMFVDATTKKIAFVDDAGGVGGRLFHRVSTASQAPAAATDVWITDSGLLIPSFGMRAGMVFRWWIDVDKTAASTAAAVLTVRTGSNQSTADASRLALTGAPVQTAVATAGIIMVQVIVRSVSASGVVAGGFGIAGGAGLGGGAHAASSTFDNTAMAGLYMGLSINTGTAGAWTFQGVQGEIIG